MRDIPVLTPSLRLRHLEVADAPSMMALNDEPSTRRWLPSHVYPTTEEAIAALEFLVASRASPGDPRLGPYVLAVERREDRQLLGHVGFSPLDDDVEVSYAIAEAQRGRGFGAEALAHACDWIAARFDVRCIVAVTAAENVASRRTLERATFVHLRDESMSFQGAPRVVSRYRRHAEGTASTEGRTG